MIVERLILQTIVVLHQIPKARGGSDHYRNSTFAAPCGVGQMITGIGGSDHCRNRWVTLFPECLGQMIPGRVGKMIPVQSLSLQFTIYPSKKTKALDIDSLRAKSVKSKNDIPNYSISEVIHTEIVYYNEPQLIYCKAVQKLLKDEGYGDFKIRLSTGANATYKSFKI
jgi:hypothetical protein